MHALGPRCGTSRSRWIGWETRATGTNLEFTWCSRYVALLLSSAGRSGLNEDAFVAESPGTDQPDRLNDVSEAGEAGSRVRIGEHRSPVARGRRRQGPPIS